MANTTITPIWVKRRCICSNVLQSFQNLADVVKTIKIYGSVKVIMNPACGNVVTRCESECAKCSGMVSTFITQISTVTVHVLHGEPNPVLGSKHGSLTCERQLHMWTTMDRAQANTSSMLRIITKYTVDRREPLDHVDQERTTLQSRQSFQRCCWNEFCHQTKRDEPRW